jgi:hypothetical protein
MPSMAALRAALVERNAEHVPEFYVLVTEEQAADIASGYVPISVRAMCRTMLDWQDDDRRRAERPLHKRRTRCASSTKTRSAATSMASTTASKKRPVATKSK